VHCSRVHARRLADQNVYAGWAFGNNAGVLDAWSGEFQTAEATIEVPFLNIGVGGLIFRSPDSSLWGAAGQASVGLNAIPTPAEVAVSEGHWTAWDAATTAYGRGLWFVDYSVGSASAHGKPHSHIQFAEPTDLAMALIQSFGILGALPSVQAVGLSIMQKHGLTISSACGLDTAPASAHH
jgi:hypothetical protein